MDQATIYTVGHSNHPLEKLIELLCANGIQEVADVRSSPYSGYATHFNKEALGAALEAAGIGYRFLGNALGGRPASTDYYDDEGRVLYGRVVESDVFREGIRALLDLAQGRRAAVLCGEEDPTHCHRRLLVGRVLMERGARLLHIRGDGSVESEEAVAEAEEFARTGGQLSLFDDEEAAEWKSTQSVSHTVGRGTSSRRSRAPESDA